METDKILNGFYKKETPLKPRVPQEASRWRRCLVMLAATYLQGMAMGTSVALSVLYPELIAAFDAPMSKVVLHQSLFAGLLAGGGVLILPIVKRYGPGPSIIAGSLVGALGLIAASLVKNLVVITFTVGIMAGIGLSITYLASSISVSWIFHGDPGTALAFLSIGTGFGRFFMPFIMEVFVDLYRWDGAFLLLGGMSFQCVSCGCYIYTCKDFFKTGIDEKDMTIKESIKKSFDKSLLTDVAIVLFVIDCFFTTMIVSMPGFFVDILFSRGLPRSKGSGLLSVFGLAIMGGRVFGFLIKLKTRVLAVYHWVYFWPLVSLCLVLSITIRAYGWLMTVIVFCGVLWGAATTLRYTITLNVCGLARYPQSVALNNSLAGLGRFFGYTLGGISKDVTGCYDVAFYLSGAAGLYISVTSAIVAVILRKRDNVKQADDSIEISGRYTRLT